ncbi:MAG: glutamate-cysteine ligase family protein [Thermodesulfovibrionia bacterium]|nr:glutamate-cysteine ligase family protein [Thermodesulfovibrionia bacterium]
MAANRLKLFEGCGIELEYIIADCETLDVMPVSDEVLRSAAGRYTTDHYNGSMGWSNELVSHVMEIKNNDPVPSLKGLSKSFHKQITDINKILSPMGGMLMPSAMHPWMNPRKETRLWARRYHNVYETYDRIFNCKRHGWANVQSMHINLSFKGDDEFGRLHAAVRLLLPMIPALAASSPVVEGKITGLQDTRLLHYAANQKKVPSIMGKIIPEPVFTKAEYKEKILGKMYRDIAEYDDENILQNEWLNSRGAIPRYERNAMEIRIADTQECPRADIAIAEIIISVLKLLVADEWSGYEEQKAWGVNALLPVFKSTIRDSGSAVIENAHYLEMFGFFGKKATANELWKHLITEAGKKAAISSESLEILRLITEEGTLSKRILRSIGRNPSHEKLKTAYKKLCECLAENRVFIE